MFRGDTQINAFLRFEVKLVSLFFFDVGKSFTAEDPKVTDIRFNPIGILVWCVSSGECESALYTYSV